MSEKEIILVWDDQAIWRSPSMVEMREHFDELAKLEGMEEADEMAKKAIESLAIWFKAAPKPPIDALSMIDGDNSVAADQPGAYFVPPWEILHLPVVFHWAWARDLYAGSDTLVLGGKRTRMTSYIKTPDKEALLEILKECSSPKEQPAQRKWWDYHLHNLK